MKAGLLFGLLAIVAAASEAGAPHSLKTEYRVDPVGIDAHRPRLSWCLPEGTKRQTAYEISSGSWQSGKVESSDSLCVEWNGPALGTGDRVKWRVRCWDERDVCSEWSDEASFVCGVMNPGDWNAEWVAAHPSTRRDFDFGKARWITSGGVYRKVFDVERVPSSAPLTFATYGGPYELEINGFRAARLPAQFFDHRRLRSVDVAAWLHVGRNVISVRIRPKDDDPRFVLQPGEVGTALILSLTCGEHGLVSDETWGCDVLGTAREIDGGWQYDFRDETESPAFRRKFAVRAGVRRATLHITGVGFYEAFLNGCRVGRKVLDPAPTDYDDRVLYSTYVLDGKLKEGENELDVLLGHGWYDNRAVAVWNWNAAPWRDSPRFIARLDIAYDDGSSDVVTSDRQWEMLSSPVLYDDIREGEVGAPSCAGRPLGVNGVVVPGPRGRHQAESLPGAEIMEDVVARSVFRLGDGSYLVEFPENFAGWIRLNVRGQPKGNVLVLRYDENVSPDHQPAVPSVCQGEWAEGGDGRTLRMIDKHFLDTASHGKLAAGAGFQTDRVVCSGQDEVYEPRFTYNGFQYVWIRGWKGELRKEDILGRFVHTSFRRTGSFACSDPRMNRLHEMMDRSYRSNFTDGYPTDCPHREKNGWTCDATIASEFAQYQYENTSGYEKWLRDICDTQNDSGDICCIAPTSGWGFKWGNGPAWDSALSVLPWTLWMYRGDGRILDEVEPYLRRYVLFTRGKADGGNLVKHGLGDWLSPVLTNRPPEKLTSSCYWYAAQRIAAKLARRRGFDEEADGFDAGAELTKASFHREFYRGNGYYAGGKMPYVDPRSGAVSGCGFQTAQAMPLAFGLVPAEEITAVRARLVEACETNSSRIAFGILGMKHVFRQLSEAGRSDLAYRMIMNENRPSPRQWVDAGATTIWEDWHEGDSKNHVALGEFAAWCYQYLAGIRLMPDERSCTAVPTGEPAFARILLSPTPVPQLEWAEASVETPHGVVRSRWERKNGKIVYAFSTPPGTTAVVRLPNRPDVSVEPGSCVYEEVEEQGAFKEK